MSVRVDNVDFAVPTYGGIGERFAVWADAVQHARSTITSFTYAGQGQDGEDLVNYSRAFVHMRQVEPIQSREGHTIESGADGVVMTWEVFLDRVETA